MLLFAAQGSMYRLKEKWIKKKKKKSTYIIKQKTKYKKKNVNLHWLSSSMIWHPPLPLRLSWDCCSSVSCAAYDQSLHHSSPLFWNSVCSGLCRRWRHYWLRTFWALRGRGVSLLAAASNFLNLANIFLAVSFLGIPTFQSLSRSSL